jgi:hypothetical protein
MPLTDKQVAPLRAQMAGNLEEHRRLLAQLDPAEIQNPYRQLVSAAFCVAAERRFPEGSSRSDVINFVANARSRTERFGEVDPQVAERVILAVVGSERIGDIDPKTSFEAQMLLLAAFTADAKYDAAGLEDFLADARKLADQWSA